MPGPLVTIRTIAVLFASFAASPALAAFSSASITFTMAGGGVYCAGAGATVNYTVTSVTINSGNVFTAQLSDATGSFAAPTSIGTLNSTALAGAISITFPGGASGSGYKIRVTSSNSAFIGTPGSAFAIDQVLTPNISITPDPSTTVGEGSVVYFASSVTNGGSAPTFQWKRNGSNVLTDGTNDAYVLPDATGGDQVQVTITPVCGSASSSNTVTVTTNPDKTQNNHSWAPRARQPDVTFGFINRSNASGFTIGNPINKAYVACGSSSITTYHKDLWEYNPQTDTWTQKADLPGVGRYNAVGFSINTKGYIGTGMTSTGVVKDFYEFDPVGNQWFSRQSLPAGASGREQAFGFGIASGSLMKGYVGGGVAAGADLKDFYEFDQPGNTWTAVGAKPDFPGGKRMGAGAFTLGDKGYVVGGYSSSTNTYFRDLYEYDPVTGGGTWTARTSMPGPNGRTRPTAFALAGYGYVGMGYSATRYEGTFYQYDATGNSWTPKPYYPGPTTKTFGVGLTVGNRSFVYKDGTMYEYNLFTLASFDSKLCSTETVPVNYDASGFGFAVGNVMAAQLSATPDFSVATNLTTISTNLAAGTINVVISPTVASGTYYFRLAASNPQMYTLLERITITQLGTNHTVTPDGGTSVCIGVPVTFNSNLSGTGFTWFKNDVEVGTDSPSYLANDLVDQDEVKAVKTYTAGCHAPVDVASATVTMTIRTPAKPTVDVVPPNVLQSSYAPAYQWYKNNDPIPNAKSQTYQMTENATYKVKITDATGCSVFSDDKVNVYTGIEDDSHSLDVLAYPSPFKEQMFLSIADHIVTQGCDFTLMNELGQPVLNKQRAEAMNKLDLTGRSPGVYILRVSFGHTTVVRKLVKLN